LVRSFKSVTTFITGDGHYKLADGLENRNFAVLVVLILNVSLTAWVGNSARVKATFLSY
jgi:hypothetical protein